MSDVISKLNLDHSHTKKLLDALERQLDRFLAGDFLDKPIIEGALTYLTYYPSGFHPPKKTSFFKSCMHALRVLRCGSTISRNHIRCSGINSAACASRLIRFSSLRQLRGRNSNAWLGSISTRIATILRWRRIFSSQPSLKR